MRSPEPDALPLILSHGWPGSIVEFMKVIGPLTDPRAHDADPADAFHVVAPSLPGFAFSGPARSTGWNLERIARAWAQWMHRLGYTRYGAQGGDTGSLISPVLGRIAPDQVVGVHVNGALGFPTGDPAAYPHLTETEQARLRLYTDTGDRSGYSAIQSTRPQTLAYGLHDSPVGQLAWIVEKFKEWTDPAAELPEDAVDRDQLLTNVTVYWLTGTAGSAARLYKDGAMDWSQPLGPSRVPTGWRSSRATPASAASPNRTTTSCTGRSSTAAATSPPWRPPTSWSPTSAPSSAPCAERSAALRLHPAPDRAVRRQPEGRPSGHKHSSAIYYLAFDHVRPKVKVITKAR